MSSPKKMERRRFLARSATLGAATALGAATPGTAAETLPGKGTSRRIKVGVIGCGSVSSKYFPHLSRCPHVELVSTCDIIPQRARKRATQFKVPNHYAHIDPMLAGAPFELFVNLTDMQEHERLNRMAIQAGKHVWSEKPIANSLDAGLSLLELARMKGVRVWGAPTPVHSPQFACMARALAAGKLGRVAAAHASYGHLGPDWSSFFYEKGGGSMPDLGVYNFTTLTGLLGPARSVVAMTSIVTPKRTIRGRGEMDVTAEDNAMVLMDHGNNVMSHVQCGFNYFTAHEHDSTDQDHETLTIVGTSGSMSLLGYDWAPHAVNLATREQRAFQRHATDAEGYVWQNGASLVAECLATGKEPLFTPEHALHVVEIMAAARDSQRAGRRIPIRSSFKWPVVA